MKYVEEVEDLFREQGFRTEKHSENGGNPTEITAERGGTSLRIAVATRDRKQIRDTGEDLMSREVEEDRSIIFTNLELTSGEKKEIEGELDEKGIGISFFYPEKEDSEVEKPDNMPSSYEIIGDIAILSLEGGQIENSEEIARAVQQQNPNVKTVLNKEEQLSGEYRVGGYQKILGNGTETVHTEHGCRYRLDPTEVYFSARLGHERDRLARQIAGKEIIHVWFAGVGPYAVLFADSKNPERVHAVEKNPKACKYMEDNIEINGVEETVVPHCGDVGKIVPELEKADRIVMPLPKSADQFLELAFERSKKGAVIHYYRFAEKEENNVKWSGVVEEVEEKAEKAGREFEIVDKTVCGHYAPYMDRVCIDVKVK